MTARPCPVVMRARPGRGLSIVELMIGIAIGLFIVAGATLMLTTQLGDNRRLLLEAQVQQDMRAAADLIVRDIRRAGYWGQAYRQVWPAAGALGNPYLYMDPAPTEDGVVTDQIEYVRSTDEDGRTVGTDDNDVDAEINRPRERVGFRLNATTKSIDYMLGADSWQALTDTDVLEVTAFDLRLKETLVPLPCGADPQCPVVDAGGCPLNQVYRNVTITIKARARHDSAVQRVLRDEVRLRNSLMRSVCPS